MLYHNIEKGLSLPSPRPGFGVDNVTRLVSRVQSYLQAYGPDEVSGFALGALRGYVTFNREAGVEDVDIPGAPAIFELISRPERVDGGVKTIRREDIRSATSTVGIEFFLSRSSVRQFAEIPVVWSDIEYATRAAQKSPAVCNRQFCRVYATTDRSTIDRALAIQAGARGFGDTVPALAVVTASMRSYWNPGERMQPWTDGGMFAMSFVLGLHSRGLGSVCLNWSKTESADAAFRDEFRIGADEVIVMLVAFGHLPEEYRVASSPRQSLERSLHQLLPKS